MKKRFIVIPALVILATYIAADIYVVKAKNYDSLIDYFFGKEEQLIINKEEYVLEEPQIIEVDDYRITLSSEICDNLNKSGYCKFMVEKNNGEDKVEYSDIHYAKGSNMVFGENGRFSFRFGISEGSVSYDIDFQEDGNILIMYMNYSLSGESFDNKMYLMDSTKGHDLDDAVGTYELTNTLETITVDVSSTTKIFLSKLSMTIKTTERLTADDIDIAIYFKDGTSKKLGCESVVGLDDASYVKCNFKNAVDTNEVDYIVYNGQKCIVTNDSNTGEANVTKNSN